MYQWRIPHYYSQVRIFRRLSIVTCLIILVSGNNFVIAEAAIKTGQTCNRLGQVTTSNGVQYQCQKFGTKKYWAPKISSGNQSSKGTGATSKNPIPLPSPTPTYYQPKLGDCFNYDYNQAFFKNVSDQPVNCQLLHTAETYRFQIWTSPINVYQDTDENVVNVAKSICTPFSYKPNTSINYWIFSFPTEVQWNMGNKWIRCDAVTLDRSGKSPRLVQWQGEPPQKQFTPATCTIESAKSYSWKSGDDFAQRRIGFYIRNSSPDRDATLVRISATFRFEDGSTDTQLVEVSRIPAGQLVGVGKVFDSTTTPITNWSYSAKCSDSPVGRVGKLIELSGTVRKDSQDSRYGLEYSASTLNSYPDVIRCKNDNYSCLVYVLFFDNLGGIAGGDTIFVYGPVYPNDSFVVSGNIYFPKSWHPEKLATFKMWIQEPQS